jgi:EAL domain-containing protein (putative c-di-GMP-specific phosphodiesterase class I)
MIEPDDRARLLVVDDDPAFGRLVRRCAEPCGFHVRISEGASCRDCIADWRPALILLDLNMPGVDGVEIMRHLAADRCQATVILASGSVDGRTLDVAARLGNERGLRIGGVLRKPVRPETLRQLLASVKVTAGPVTAAALAEAIEAGQLFLEYQPKLDCGAGLITGVEALVRWRRPVVGIVPPDCFIPLAEETGLIDPLTDWLFATAMAQAASWHRSGLPLRIAVNLSGKNLGQIDLPERLAACCREAAVEPEQVVLELTETHAMADAVKGTEVVTRLRLKGFGLSIDDFGTGYSSLVQLHRLPFTEIKIDRSFITELPHNHECRDIAETIVALARKIGLECIAEGVETAAALDAVMAMGCDGAQGYYLSRPLPPLDVPQFVRRSNATKVPEVA